MNTTASKIPYSLLSLEAVLELSTQSHEIIASRHSEDALLSRALAALEKPMDVARLTIGSSRKQKLTQQINDADRNRDRGFIGFRKSIEAHRYNIWEPAAQQAAEDLLEIIRKHGKQLHLEGMTVQSALMTSLFDDLEAEQAKSNLATLGLTNWFEQLKITENAFTDLLLQRNQIESAKNIPTRSEAKAPLVEALYSLISGVDFLTDTDPDTYGETHALITENAERIVTAERGR